MGSVNFIENWFLGSRGASFEPEGMEVDEIFEKYLNK